MLNLHLVEDQPRCEQCEEKEADYLMVDDCAICLDCLDELTKAMRAKWRAANEQNVNCPFCGGRGNNHDPNCGLGHI